MSIPGGITDTTVSPPLNDKERDLESQRRPSDNIPLTNPAPAYAGLPDGFRNHLISCIAEFVGTFMFLLFAFVIAQIANSDISLNKVGSNPTQLVYIALGFGFSVMVCVFCFYRISGGHLNPAVSLTLLLLRVIGPARAAVNMSAQFIAGICAAAVADALTPGPLLFANTLGGNANRVQGLFIEMFATALLCMTVTFMAVEKHRATFMAPLAIGIALFIGHMFAIFYSGAGINPARSLGPDVVQREFPNYAWIYYVGPFMASFLAAFLYYLLKYLHCETTNPGQDAKF